ncbi:MAG: hypothetical protein ACRESJ_02715 [Pseudomonas sp.]|uniref:hypothetical protein n=1 Tax=Pseudomonas sp. TaxID=306 RepID=UPI003D6F9684
MKALVEESISMRTSKTNKKRPARALPANQLRLLKAALEGTGADEPVGVLAGASFKFTS